MIPKMATTNDVLAANQDALSAQLGEVKAMVQGFATTFARSDVLELRFKEVDLQIKTINVEIIKLQDKKVVSAWLLPVITFVAGSGIAFLLIEYIKGVK